MRSSSPFAATLIGAVFVVLSSSSTPAFDSLAVAEESSDDSAIAAAIENGVRINPNDACWHLPAMRATTRAFLRSNPATALARAKIALAEGDVPLASALLVLAQRHGPIDQDDPVAEAIRMAAVEALARRDIPWGAHPFLTLAANPSLASSSRAMAETLLDQLEPDDVKGNAYASCELYLVGLQEDWDAWLDVLLDRCARRVKTPGGEWQAWDQPQTLLTSLAFLAAMHGPEGLRDAQSSWWFLAYAREQARFAGFQRASDAQQRQLLELAHKWYGGYAVREGEYEVHSAHGNRSIAWWMLEGMFPQSATILREIALNAPEYHWYHQRRAVAVILVNDPGMLTTSSWDNILPEVVASYNGHWSWPAARLGEFFRGPIPEDEPFDCHFPSLLDIIGYEPARERAEFISVGPHREAILRTMRETLTHESNPQRQLNLADFLFRAKDPLASDLISTTIVSNLVDDDVWGNRERARWMMRGPQDNDAMHAGLRLGMEMRDWQLVTDAALHLLTHESNGVLNDRPDIALFIMDQLADDDIAGNAAAATSIFRAADPMVARRAFATRESRDEQEEQRRSRVLDWIATRESSRPGD